MCSNKKGRYAVPHNLLDLRVYTRQAIDLPHYRADIQIGGLVKNWQVERGHFEQVSGHLNSIPDDEEFCYCGRGEQAEEVEDLDGESRVFEDIDDGTHQGKTDNGAKPGECNDESRQPLANARPHTFYSSDSLGFESNGRICVHRIYGWSVFTRCVYQIDPCIATRDKEPV